LFVCSFVLYICLIGFSPAMRPCSASSPGPAASWESSSESPLRLQRLLDTHQDQLTKLRTEVSAIRDCIESVGLVSHERFLVHLHARHFATIQCAHPCLFEASLVHLLQAPGIVDFIAAAVGLPGIRSLRGAGQPVLQALAAVAPDLGSSSSDSGEVVCVIGGFNGTQCLNFVECLDPVSGVWRSLQPMGERRAGTAAAVVAGRTYVLGGSDDLQCLSSVERLDLATDVWETLPPMSDRRDGAACANVGNKIYIFGGYNGLRFLSSVERFDPSMRCWVSLPEMAERRYRGAAAVLSHQIYVVGGSDDLRCLSSAQRFDHTTGEWESLAPMEVRRDGTAVVAFEGKLYVLGGYDGMRYLNSAEVFDPEIGLWSPIEPMAERRYRAAASIVHGQIYAFGGYDGRMYLNSSERFSPSTGSWEAAPPMRTRRAWAAAVAVQRWGSSGCPPLRWGRLGMGGFAGGSPSVTPTQQHHVNTASTLPQQTPVEAFGAPSRGPHYPSQQPVVEGWRGNTVSPSNAHQAWS